MGKQKCLIVGAGPELFWDERFTPDLILCADGGLDHARDLGLRPHVCIGDRDSLSAAPGPETVFLSHPAEKNYTDLQACVEYAIAQKVSEVAVIGASGGRLDHFMANVGLLESLFLRGIGGVILNEQNEIGMIAPFCAFAPPHPYCYLSLVPLDERVTGVFIEGVKYPLSGATLRRCDTLGVSNEPLPGKTVRIDIGAGRALVIRSVRV